jgi:hypothetical protein
MGKGRYTSGVEEDSPVRGVSGTQYKMLNWTDFLAASWESGMDTQAKAAILRNRADKKIEEEKKKRVQDLQKNKGPETNQGY